MINTVNIDLTNSSCWGTSNAAGEGSEITLYIKLLESLLNKTDIHLEFTKPDGVIVTTSNLNIINEQASYEMPLNLYITKGTLKLRILATNYTSNYINFNIADNYTETDDLCVKINNTTKEFNINKCVPKSIIDEEILKQIVEAAKTAALKVENPIGKIRLQTTNINPATYLGFGTWVLWGSGKVPVGVDTAQTEFSTVEKTGGSKELQSHSHSFSATTGNQSANHTHSFSATTSNKSLTGTFRAVNLAKTTMNGTGIVSVTDSGDTSSYTGMTQNKREYGIWNINASHDHTISGTSGSNSTNHTHNVSGTTGSSGSGNSKNLQPYITCYMWKRTA